MFYRSLLLPDLRESLADGDAPALAEFGNALYPAVLAEVLEDLTPDEVWTVLRACPPARQAEIFGFLEGVRQVQIVDVAPRKELSRLIEEMAPDDRVDFLGLLEDEQVEELLPLIAQAERADIRKLLAYPDGSAGSIMTTEYASLPEGITVDEAFERLRVQAPDSETIYYIYIVDEGRRLDGIVSLRQLIQAKRTAQLADIMRRDVISVRVDDDEEFVAQEVGRYDFLAIPVVDNQNRLVGIVTYDDALDIIQDEADEDAQLQAAVLPFDDSYMSTPLHVLAQKRGVWLVILLVAALATAFAMKQFEDIQETYVWMAWFVPLVLASGGNAGSQSATLIIREMATREMDSADFMTIFLRELKLASMLGACLATLSFAAAITLVSLSQGMVVSSTVFVVVVLGTVTGAMLPILFKKLGMDPALMSNPLIAALVDVFGVIIYFSAAVIVLGPVVSAK
ncbi:MAG: magnesium transporter [Planctomycetota bacterium]|jgi:magnesium transporter